MCVSVVPAVNLATCGAQECLVVSHSSTLLDTPVPYLQLHSSSSLRSSSLWSCVSFGHFVPTLPSAMARATLWQGLWGLCPLNPLTLLAIPCLIILKLVASLLTLVLFGTSWRVGTGVSGAEPPHWPSAKASSRQISAGELAEQSYLLISGTLKVKDGKLILAKTQKMITRIC